MTVGAHQLPQHPIRPMRPAELPAVVELANRFYREEGFATPRARLARNLARLAESPDGAVHVAVDATDVPVAFAVTTTTSGLEHSRVGELQDLYVHPHHRNTGIATTLIENAAAWATDRGCEALDIVVANTGDARPTLVDYYTRRGFTDQHRRLFTLTLRSPETA